MSKTALVVSGGGSKGAFAVGAVKYLNEAGHTFDLISGTSTGALIAPMVAINDIDILEKIYTTVKTSDIVRHNWRKLYWNGILDTKPLERLIRKHLSEEGRFQAVMDSAVTVLLCAVSLQTEATTYFTQKAGVKNAIKWDNLEEMISCILASTNQPVFTPAVSFRGQQYVDGGVREVIPVQAALDAGCDKIFVIANSPCTPNIKEKQFKNVATVGMRSLGIMSSETSTNDITDLIAYNDVLSHIANIKEAASEILSPAQIDNVFSGGEKFRPAAEITLIKPEVALPMDGLKFEPEKMTVALHIGYAMAKKVLNSKV